jgi:hypothetical protein
VNLLRNDVSEVYIASFFKAEKFTREENILFSRGVFYPKDGEETFLRNVGPFKNHTAPHPRRRHSSYPPL